MPYCFNMRFGPKSSFLFCYFLAVLFISSNADAEVLFKNTSSVYLKLEKKLQSLDKSRDPQEYAETQLEIAAYLIEFGLYEQATLQLKSAQGVFLEQDLELGMAQTYNLLGRLNYKSISVSKALDYHEKAYVLFKKAENSSGMIHSLGLIGSMHEKLGNYDLALSTQREALKKFTPNESKELKANILENIGSIYEDLEVFDSAKIYFSRAFDLIQDSSDRLAIIGVINNLGDAYRKSGSLDSGKFYTQKALAMSLAIDNLQQIRSAWSDLAKTELVLGNPELAFDYLDRAKDIEEKIFSSESARNLAVLESQFEHVLQSQRIEQLESLRLKDLWLKGSLATLAILLGAIGWLIYTRQKTRIDTGRDLLKQQESLLKLNEDLAFKERENRELLELKLATEAESFARSQSLQKIHIIEKNELLENIRQKLEGIINNDPREQKKRVRNLLKEIDYYFTKDEDWSDFHETVGYLNTGFFQELQKRGIELTPSESKLASLMRMDLSSKEIASTLGISQASLRISRHRLRKKLNLEKGESLRQFILCS